MIFKLVEVVNMDELDSKYKNVEYAEFYDSTLISKKEKVIIRILDNIMYIFLLSFMIITVVGMSFDNMGTFVGISFFVIIIGAWFAVFYYRRLVMNKCVTLLGKEYYDYKENELLKEHKFIKKLDKSFLAWKESLFNNKYFKEDYGIKRKRFPLMLTKGAAYYFDFNILVFFENVPEENELKKILDHKIVNLVFCIKPIDMDKNEEEYHSLLEPGYLEKEIDSQIVRFATIYFNKKTNEIIHRPRAFMYNLKDHFMSKFDYAKEPSVIVDYSLDVSNYLLAVMLEIDLD